MKPTIKPLMTLLVLIQLNSIQAQSWFSSGIGGSGNKTTQMIQTEDYDIIQAHGPIEIHLKKGKEGEIAVTTSDNLHQYLEVESNNNRLEIRLKKGVSIKRNGNFELSIPFESISKVSLSGSGVIDTEDPISGSLDISLSGSGNIDLKLDTEKVGTQISGAGNIKFSGTSKDSNLSISGSANYNGLELETQNTSIEISGSGRAKVNASESLKARISGSGSVQYKGKPDKVNTNISGSGSVKTID